MQSREDGASKPAVDLTNCDREPIHIPGAVQSYTVLLAGEAGGLEITHVSENAKELLGIPAAEALGGRFDALLGRTAMHEIGNAEISSDDPSRPGLLFGIRLDDVEGVFDVAVHQHDGRRIVEFQRDHAQHSALDNAAPISLVNAFAAKLSATDTPQELWDTTAYSVRTLLGFDRVMVYQFQPDDSGKVVAESRRRDLVSWHGLHYPASDIPKQARELYRLNLTRAIADVNATASPILALPGEAAERPLDLSYSSGRAVSPIHIEYLQNMGVGASMSISVVVNGRLWGLIACHHYAAKAVPLPVRAAGQLFAQFFSVRLEAAERAESFEVLHAARDRIDSVVRSVAAEASVFRSLSEQMQRLQAIIPSEGFALMVDGEMELRGKTPPKSDIHHVARLLVETGGGRVFATNQIADVYPPAERFSDVVSGALAIPFGSGSEDCIVYFRQEMVETVTWAGDPTKPATPGPLGDRLTPRKSFELWKEERRGRSVPWSSSDRLLAETLRVALMEVTLGARETIIAERNRSQKRQKVLISELNHRVKNILALMNALVARGRESDSTIEEFVQGLEGRIRALSFAHDHITRNSVSSLRALLETEAAPFLSEGQELSLDGPPLTLDARSFPIVSLVTHELMTNAAKYGALSADKGRLEVRWTYEPDKDLQIHWEESGGPEVKEPSRKGFGSVLIERNIPFELGGRSNVRFEPAGLEVDLTIPAEHVRPAKERKRAKSAAAPNARELNGLEVLVVEDQLMIALNAQKMLEELGADQVETAANTADALKWLESTDEDGVAAILDVNLGSETSIRFARTLRERSVPFIFATGYNDSLMIPADLRDVPIVRKPYTGSTLFSALKKAISGS